MKNGPLIFLLFLSSCAGLKRVPSSAPVENNLITTIDGHRGVLLKNDFYYYAADTIKKRPFQIQESGREKFSPEIFFNEAKFQIMLSRLLTPPSSSDFLKFINQMEQKLDKSYHSNHITTKKLIQTDKKMYQLFSQDMNKVDRLNFYGDIIFKVYNPIQPSGEKVSDETILVPLNKEWFFSHPELKVFFHKTWVNSGKDIRIMYGSSGEGVSEYNQDRPALDSSYWEMAELMLVTKDFLLKNQQSSYLNDPEAKWILKNANIEKFKNHLRMIFIHPETWERNSQAFQWAEFIPVDQRINGLPTDYLFSVLIHEINVNSLNFLGSDTHSPFEDSTETWNEAMNESGPVVEKTISQKEAAYYQRFFGLNPHLAMIYLALELDFLEEKN